VDHLVQYVLARVLLRSDGFIEMKLSALLASDQSFFVHYLQEFEDRSVPVFVVAAHRLIHVSDGYRAISPQNLQDFQLFFCRPYKWVSGHITNCFVSILGDKRLENKFCYEKIRIEDRQRM
jgi:hypothetical protein